MKSANPNSGIYKADTARTLDSQGGSPACNQGGMAVVCLNDQGGGVMNVSVEKTATLRAQTHGHEPIVMGVDTCNQSVKGEVSKSLTNKATDSDHIPIVCLEGNGSRDSHKGDGYKESETMYTLNTVEQHGVCYSQDRFDKYTENDKSPALLHTGGSYGGGSETLIVSRNEEGQHLTYQDVVGTLCSRDMKGVGNEYVDEGKCIIQRISNRKSSE